MPYNPETEQFFQAPATIVDSTPDGDTVQEGFDDRLTPAMEGVYTDLNLLKENGMIGVGIPATTTSRGIARVATLSNMEPGAIIEDGPAFLAAGSEVITPTPTAHAVPQADGNGLLADGWIRGQSSRGASSHLRGSANGTNASVGYTADEIVVKDSNDKYKTLRNLSLTAATSATGANGLDTGSIAASTFYFCHVIHNPTTNATALLLSLSATSPSLPTGYTYWARVGAIRTDATNKYPLPFVQHGRAVALMPSSGTNLTSLPVIASGVQGTITNSEYAPVSTSLSGFVPSTAASVDVMGSSPGGVYVAASASTGFSGGTSATPPPLQNGARTDYLVTTVRGTFQLSSMSLYYAAKGAACTLQLIGWEDNL